MRSPRAIPVLMLAGLAITACGARLPQAVSNQAKSSVLNQGSISSGSSGGSGIGSTGTGSTGTGSTGTGSTGTGSTGTGSTGTGSTGTGSTGTGSTGTGSTGTGSTGTGSTGTGSTGTGKTGTGKTGTGTTQATSCNSASISGTGVSSSGITIGTVADVTGPVSGLFTGAEQGIEAFANYVNATQGGICGHPLHVLFQDGGTNCTQNENATSGLVSKVFAFVGSFSLYDNCGATILKAHPNTPDIHVALDPAAEPLPNHFDLEPGALGYQTGPFAYYAHKYGAKVKKAGTIYEAIPSAEAKQNAQVKAAEASGWHFTYDQGEQPTNSDFETDFVKMCQQQHIQVFFTVTEDAQNAATMIQDEKQAGCPSSLINIIPIAYDSAFTSAFNSNQSEIDGVQGWSEYALFYNADEAAHIPAVATFQQWFKRTYPGQPINLYAMYAWADGLLFEQGLESAGSKITQQSVIGALRKVKNFTAGGLVAPATPSSKTTGITCYIVWAYANGQFNRSSGDPSNNYICNGSRFVTY